MICIYITLYVILSILISLVDTGSLILAKLVSRSYKVRVGSCKFIVLGGTRDFKRVINFFVPYFLLL